MHASSCYCEKYVLVDISHKIWQLNLGENALESHVNEVSVALHTFFSSAVSDLFVFFFFFLSICRDNQSEERHV